MWMSSWLAIFSTMQSWFARLQRFLTAALARARTCLSGIQAAPPCPAPGWRRWPNIRAWISATATTAGRRLTRSSPTGRPNKTAGGPPSAVPLISDQELLRRARAHAQREILFLGDRAVAVLVDARPDLVGHRLRLFGQRGRPLGFVELAVLVLVGSIETRGTFFRRGRGLLSERRCGKRSNDNCE